MESATRDEAVKAWDIIDAVELEKLRQLTERLADQQHAKNEPDQLIRFLRARSWDVELAEAMFRKSMEWRRRVGADEILSTWAPPDYLDKYWPCRLLPTCDDEGDPVIVDRVGRNDIYGLLRAFGTDVMTTHATWIREKLFDQAKRLWAETGPRHSSTGRRLTVITDLDGLTLSAVSSMDVLYFLEATMKLDQGNYPESAKQLIVINAPWAFRTVWSMVKPFFDEGVRAKMRVVPLPDTPHVMATLLRSPQHVPACLPGCRGTSPFLIPEGGRVPKSMYLKR